MKWGGGKKEERRTSYEKREGVVMGVRKKMIMEKRIEEVREKMSDNGE